MRVPVELMNWKDHLHNGLLRVKWPIKLCWLSRLSCNKNITQNHHPEDSAECTTNTFCIIHLRWRSNDCGRVSNSTIKQYRHINLTQLRNICKHDIITVMYSSYHVQPNTRHVPNVLSLVHLLIQQEYHCCLSTVTINNNTFMLIIQLLSSFQI